jgi:hypothetical protein
VVPVHDLVIHPRDGDLIAATHGRSLWILDDITPLQQLTPTVLASDAHLFTQKVATIWRAISRGATRGHLPFQGRNPLTIAHRPPANSPSELQNSATVTFYLKEAPSGPVQLQIASIDGGETFTAEIPATAGINRYFWNLRFGAAPAGGVEGRGGRGGRGGGGRGGGGRGGDPAQAAGGAQTAGGAQAGAAQAGGAQAAQAGRQGGARGQAGATGEEPDAPPQAGRGRGGRGGGGGAAAAEPGSYRVTLTVGGRALNGLLVVRADPEAERAR